MLYQLRPSQIPCHLLPFYDNRAVDSLNDLECKLGALSEQQSPPLAAQEPTIRGCV